MTSNLSRHHRDTIAKIFSHPSSGNLEWRQVLSMLTAVGDVSVGHNGRVAVTLGQETEVLYPPQGKDVGIEMIVDLRRMLANAGLGPGGLVDASGDHPADHPGGRPDGRLPGS